MERRSMLLLSLLLSIGSFAYGMDFDAYAQEDEQRVAHLMSTIQEGNESSFFAMLNYVKMLEKNLPSYKRSSSLFKKAVIRNQKQANDEMLLGVNRYINGTLCLVEAAKIGNRNMVIALKESGALPEMPDFQGHRAFEYAEFCGFNEVADLIRVIDNQEYWPRDENNNQEN